MRIAYFNANLKQGQDGVTRCVYRMIEAAQQRGHSVAAITATMPDEKVDFPVYRVPSFAFPLQKSYRLAVPGYQSFAAYLHSFQPDIIHVNSPCTLGFGAVKFAKEFGIPVVATYHTHFPTYPRYYHLKKLEELTWKISRNFYNQIDRTFVPTTPILDELTQHGLRNLQHLPNGVDENLFHPRYRSEAWRTRFAPTGKPIVLFVSRLVWEKDLHVLADAYTLLRNHRSDFELVIVGDGHARAEFEPLVPGAHFLGYQSGPALSESFASADLFVFPSTTETFGLVTLEAMASGLVPVAANAGGAAEIIVDGTSGLLARPLDAIDLAAKLESLLDNPARRSALSHEAEMRSRQYLWSDILCRLFHYYEEVILEQHARRLHAA
jgi:glycosyltransferase involved in cell wall biosynthesis